MYGTDIDTEIVEQSGMQTSQFLIDLRSSSITLDSTLVRQRYGGECKIRFKGANSLLHVGTMALVARQHQRNGDTSFVAIRDCHQEIESLRSKLKHPLREPYGAIRKFWMTELKLSANAITVHVSAKEANKDQLPILQVLVVELLASKGSPKREHLKLKFNGEALKKIGLAPSDFRVEGLDEILANESGSIAPPITTNAQATKAIIPAGNSKAQPEILTNAPPPPSTTDYWFELGLKLLTELENVQLRCLLYRWLVLMAAETQTPTRADKLLTAYRAEAIESSLPIAKKVNEIWGVAQLYAWRGDKLAANVTVSRLPKVSDETLNSIGIWSQSPGGLNDNLLPYFVSGHVKRGEYASAIKLLPQFATFAKQKALAVTKGLKWDASVQFIETCATIAPSSAIEHLRWMAQQHFIPQNRAQPICCLLEALFAAEMPAQALKLTRQLERYIACAEIFAEGYFVWLTCLIKGYQMLARSKREELFSRLLEGIRRDQNVLVRSQRLAEVASCLVENGLLEFGRRAAAEAKLESRRTQLPVRSRKNDIRLEAARSKLLTFVALTNLKAFENNRAEFDLAVAEVLAAAQRFLEEWPECELPEVVAFLTRNRRSDDAILIASVRGVFRPESGIVRELALIKANEKLRVLYDHLVTVSEKVAFLISLSPDSESTRAARAKTRQ